LGIGGEAGADGAPYELVEDAEGEGGAAPACEEEDALVFRGAKGGAAVGSFEDEENFAAGEIRVFVLCLPFECGSMILMCDPFVRLVFALALARLQIDVIFRIRGRGEVFNVEVGHGLACKVE
jgi:hypothetical protein